MNIAEGSTGQSNDEFKRFLSYAVRSGAEVVACLYLAKGRNYIDEIKFKELYDFIDSLLKKNSGVKKLSKIKSRGQLSVDC